MKNMQLTKNFTLADFCKSDTATRLGIDNTPGDEEIKNLMALAEKVVQPVRDKFRKGFTPNSGFRCLELNRAVKSSDTSQHLKGQAADIEVPGVSNYKLACWIRDNLEFDQIILEFYTPGDPSSGWVHVSYRRDGKNRKNCITINKDGTKAGFVE